MGNGAYVVLREPTLLEFKKFSEKGDANLEAARKLFPVCVIDTNLEDDDGNKATGQMIFESLDKSATTFSAILTEWLTKLPFRSYETSKVSN